ncbi:hypothetical protein [Nevskia ramosa]|uniref:hypothetical protein n=1 Tax=Nevskia ramosa TaxID=64002 RepID=UPI003D100F5F
MKPDPIREDDRTDASPREDDRAAAAVRTLEAMGFGYTGGDFWTSHAGELLPVWIGVDHAKGQDWSSPCIYGPSPSQTTSRDWIDPGAKVGTPLFPSGCGIREAGSSFGGRSLDRNREP